MNVILNKAKFYLCPVIYGSGIKNSIIQAMALNMPIVCLKKMITSHFLNETNSHSFDSREKMLKAMLKARERNWNIDNKRLIDNSLSWARCVNSTLEL